MTWQRRGTLSQTPLLGPHELLESPMIQLRLGAWMVTLIAPIFPRVIRAVRHLCRRPHLCCWLLFGSMSGVLLTGRLRVLLGISRSSHRRASRCNKASTFPQFGQGNVTYARINVSVFYFCPVLATLAPLFFFFSQHKEHGAREGGNAGSQLQLFPPQHHRRRVLLHFDLSRRCCSASFTAVRILTFVSLPLLDIR